MFSCELRFQRQITSEEGTATVEAVLWLPLFVFAFGLVFDAAVLFFSEAEAIRVVQEANRLASIGRLETVTDTESYIETHLGHLSLNAKATSSISANGVISSVVEIPSGELRMLGFFEQLTRVELKVGASQMMEDFT